MNKNFKFAVVAMGLLFASLAQAQLPDLNARNRFLTLSPGTGMPIIPIMEGWYDNGDGSVTASLGYHNRNNEEMHIPIGPNNFIEPERFNGMQPTHFNVGRDTGVFTIDIPADMVAAGEDVWWNLKVGEAEILRVPARKTNGAYQLDRNPRPQGTVEPTGWVYEDGARGTGPNGVTADFRGQVRVGTPVELTVHAEDTSVRDPEDPRFTSLLPLRLSWYQHQGPGRIEFGRHANHPEIVRPEGERPRRGDFPGNNNQPNVVILPEPRGTATVYATFSEPGEYVVRTVIDNWNAPDSSEGNQCCWTNVYTRVTVSP